VFTLSENPGRGWFLRSLLDIGITRERIKRFAQAEVTRSRGFCQGDRRNHPWRAIRAQSGYSLR